MSCVVNSIKPIQFFQLEEGSNFLELILVTTSFVFELNLLYVLLIREK